MTNVHDNYPADQAERDALGFAFMWAVDAENDGPYMGLGPVAYAYALEDQNVRPEYPQH